MPHLQACMLPTVFLEEGYCSCLGGYFAMCVLTSWVPISENQTLTCLCYTHWFLCPVSGSHRAEGVRMWSPAGGSFGRLWSL